MGLFIHLTQSCPICGAQVPTDNAFGQPLVCPKCDARLQTSVNYTRREGYAGLAIAVLIAVVAGARDWWIVLDSILLWFPCGLLVGSIALRCFPPKLEPWDGRKIV